MPIRGITGTALFIKGIASGTPKLTFRNYGFCHAAERRIKKIIVEQPREEKVQRFNGKSKHRIQIRMAG